MLLQPRGKRGCENIFVAVWVKYYESKAASRLFLSKPLTNTGSDSEETRSQE